MISIRIFSRLSTLGEHRGIPYPLSGNPLLPYRGVLYVNFHMEANSHTPQKSRTVAINVQPSTSARLAAAAARFSAAAAARLTAASEDRRMIAGGDWSCIEPHPKRCLAGCKHLFSSHFIFSHRVKPYDFFFDMRPPPYYAGLVPKFSRLGDSPKEKKLTKKVVFKACRNRAWQRFGVVLVC